MGWLTATGVGSPVCLAQYLQSLSGRPDRLRTLLLCCLHRRGQPKMSRTTNSVIWNGRVCHNFRLNYIYVTGDTIADGNEIKWSFSMVLVPLFFSDSLVPRHAHACSHTASQHHGMAWPGMVTERETSHSARIIRVVAPSRFANHSKSNWAFLSLDSESEQPLPPPLRFHLPLPTHPPVLHLRHLSTWTKWRERRGKKIDEYHISPRASGIILFILASCHITHTWANIFPGNRIGLPAVSNQWGHNKSSCIHMHVAVCGWLVGQEYKYILHWHAITLRCGAARADNSNKFWSKQIERMRVLARLPSTDWLCVLCMFGEWLV